MWCKFGHVTYETLEVHLVHLEKEVHPALRAPQRSASHTVDYDPFIKSELASRN